ncbi:Hypothetical predicted protein, partial [Mytilus galloprovincialis]
KKRSRTGPLKGKKKRSDTEVNENKQSSSTEEGIKNRLSEEADETKHESSTEEAPEHEANMARLNAWCKVEDVVSKIHNEPGPPEEEIPEYSPDEGISCEVKGCETPGTKSNGMYCKHWLRFHTKKTSIIICRLCQRKLGIRSYLLQHWRDFHKLNIKARTEEVLNTIPQLIDYMHFIDPGKTIKCVQATEAAKKERRILSEKINRKELFPNLHGVVIVPIDHEAHIFKMPNMNMKGGQVLQLKKKPG